MPVRALIGTSGWSYRHWAGAFYPEDLPSKLWLEHYADHFTTVELNASFYHLPKERTVERWRERTPEGFVFSLKASRYITHRKRLVDVAEPLSRFYSIAGLLEEKLGPVLFQLPPFMHYDPERLDRFLGELDGERMNVVEFRHGSWFIPECYDICRRHGVAVCVVSAPHLPCEPVVTAPFAYVRWHGISGWYDYRYTDDDLSWWARTISDLDVPVYGYFNNDTNAYAVANARDLGRQLV